jgi:alpha-L-fucosidase 2
MKLNNGTALRKAAGENKNLFYQTEETSTPVISEKATVTPPALQQTFVYDFPTKPGQSITLISK